MFVQAAATRRLNTIVANVALELSGALPHASYDSSRYGEVVVAYLTFVDPTLRDGELPCHLRDQIATSFSIFTVSVPTVIGGEHGFIPVVTLTDGEKIMLLFYSSYKDVVKIDSIDETEDGNVTLRHGDDVMILQTGRDNVECYNNNVGSDFDIVQGKLLKATDYPREFNWGCDLLGDDVGYCRVLRKHRCELERLGGDVCVLTHSPISKRCPSFMRIERLTGFFRDALFLPTESTPIESLEAEWINRDHEVGIQFPCLSQ
ncbi:hypothetical protein HOLleu_44453 [Holothuria leucospilota]|uniref:Uncharacterized protein n=1 Tax=Holothuria leucospilota TaxID=206669 RepID=A0A9Q0Y8U9_HOLLE|nr:hypothetical protein HOLleu_44453 [Holothuria leucospilota]